MSFKAMLGTFLALVLAVGGTAFLISRSSAPEPPKPPDPQKGETVLENPFDLKGPGPHPKAVVTVKHFDFGVMALGDEQSYEFEFRNEGSGPLKLAKGHVQCKCTIPNIDTGEIPPNGSTKIKLTWKPLEATLEFKKEAGIWTNDPENPLIVLSIHGSVFDDPSRFPETFSMGNVSWDQEHHSEMVLYSTASSNLEISGYESSDPQGAELTWKKLEGEDMAKVIGNKNPKPQVVYQLDAKFKPTGQVGLFRGWFKLKVNRKNGEDYQIDFSGTRLGPIQLHGADYQAGLSLIDLRRFKSDDGGKTIMFVRLDPFGEDLKITETTSKSGFISAALTKEATQGAGKDVYKLEIIAKPKIPVGTTFSLENPDKLDLKLNHPKIPVLNFVLRYIVQ